MNKGVIITVLALAMLGGCVDNETSFYIEHLKSPPQAPECSVTESDDFVASGTLDLSFRNPYGGWYLVTNQLLAREDYGNAIAESNGIIIDGVEMYVRGLNGALIGGTEYYEFEMYIEPEDSAIAAAILISSSVVDDLASQYSCPTPEEFPDGTTSGINIGSVYSVVRFLGHSSGGAEVLTPEFTFPISICCGCVIKWSNCQSNCSKYCEEIEEHTMCTTGVYNGGEPFDCREIYHDEDATWPAGYGEVCGDPDPTMCNCSDCGGTS